MRAGEKPVRDLAASLDRVAGTVRRLLIVRGAAWVAAGAIGGAVALGLIDLGLRLPHAGRALLLGLGLGALGWLGVRLIAPAWRLRLPRSTLARRLETLDPSLSGTIAPAVDLLEQSGDGGEPGALARAGIDRASDAVARVRADRLVRWSGLGRAGCALGGALAVVLLLAVLAPAMTSIGARRVLLPFSDARWPTRFGVTDLTETAVHPIDEALAVRVGVGPGDPGSRVRLEWRFGDDGVTERSPMTAQPGGAGGMRAFERLIDPGTIEDSERSPVLRYRVVTPDDRSDWVRVRLVRPPEVVSASVLIEPPAHAVGAPGLTNFRTGTRDIGTGDAAIGPVLGGSAVTLRWQFSSEVDGVDASGWSAAPIGVNRPDGRTLEITLSPEAPARIAPVIRDEHGLGLRVPIVVGLDVRPDASPGVQIAEPGADQIVTPEAELAVRVESVDEVGVTGVELLAERWAKPDTSPGAAPEPAGEPVVVDASSIDGASTRVELSSMVSPAALGAKAGDEILLVGVARDTRGQAGEVRSQARRLRVLSPEDFGARLRAQLDPVSRLLRRSDDEQKALGERTRAGEPAESLAREQIGLADAVASATRAVRELGEAAETNRIEDPSLRSLLRDLQATLREAGADARDAARAIDAGDRAAAQEEQRGVRERLGEAMAMLDRGEDAFLARRAVARLREQLAQAQQDTGAIGQQTAGKSDAELTNAERAELDRLAQQQQELADNAREALEELTRRAESLEKDDPAQAEALRRAAEAGRAGAVANRIQQGGQETQENQTGQAQQSQQEALDRLDEMLEQIDSAGGLRDTALRRKLADLMQSITALIETQERELGALVAAMGGERRDGLAQGMIGLRDNTLGVIDDASAALAELRLIAEALREAERAQSDAVVSLRQDPPGYEAAEVRERASLDLLRQALEEAQKQDDQARDREQERKKAELRRAYRDALQAQSAVRDDAAPLIGRALNRRERIEARRVGTAQTDLADAMATLKSETDELGEAPVFELAHEQLDLLMRGAGEAMGEPTPPASVGLDQDQAIALLASLVEVLGEDNGPSDEDFQDGSQGDGGGGQGGGDGEQPLIPPVAELRLLRDMQRAAMDLTRRLDEAPDLREPARLQRLGGLQRSLAEKGAALIERMNQPPPGSEQMPVEPSETPENDGAGEPSADDAG